MAHNMKITVVIIFSLFLMGYLGDKVGFKKVMGASLATLFFVIYPLFWFIQGTPPLNKVMLMQSILALLAAGVSAPCCLMSTFFPAKERYSGYSFRSEEHTSELQSLMRISYAVFCLKKQKNIH